MTGVDWPWLIVGWIAGVFTTAAALWVTAVVIERRQS